MSVGIVIASFTSAFTNSLASAEGAFNSACATGLGVSSAEVAPPSCSSAFRITFFGGDDSSSASGEEDNLSPLREEEEFCDLLEPEVEPDLLFASPFREDTGLPPEPVRGGLLLDPAEPVSSGEPRSEPTGDVGFGANAGSTSGLLRVAGKGDGLPAEIGDVGAFTRGTLDEEPEGVRTGRAKVLGDPLYARGRRPGEGSPEDPGEATCDIARRNGGGSGRFSPIVAKMGDVGLAPVRRVASGLSICEIGEMRFGEPAIPVTDGGRLKGGEGLDDASERPEDGGLRASELSPGDRTGDVDPTGVDCVRIMSGMLADASWPAVTRLRATCPKGCLDSEDSTGDRVPCCTACMLLMELGERR